MKKIIFLAILLIISVSGNIVLSNAYRAQKKSISEYSLKLNECENRLNETQKQLAEETNKRERFADMCQTLYGKKVKLEEKLEKLESQQKDNETLSKKPALKKTSRPKKSSRKKINMQL